jgi:hypothetical protein
MRRRNIVRESPGVSSLNCDLSDHHPLPAEIRYRIADHPHLVYVPLAAEAFGDQAPGWSKPRQPAIAICQSTGRSAGVQRESSPICAEELRRKFGRIERSDAGLL